MRTRTKIGVAAAAALGLFLVTAVPANAATVGVPGRTCGTVQARYVYISSTGLGDITHVHVNGTQSSFTSYHDTSVTPRFSTAHYTTETAPYLNLGSNARVTTSGTSCDN